MHARSPEEKAQSGEGAKKCFEGVKGSSDLVKAKVLQQLLRLLALLVQKHKY
jgi:hypothetical protein